MPPSSTIIITGGTGALGSALARSLETSYPGHFYLLLTCRNKTDTRALSISQLLTSQNSSFSLENLDLSDLGGVRSFASRIKSQISAGEIPGLVGGGIVNSAAYMTFVKDATTKEGKDVMYTINCLAPALLVRCLLPVLMGDGEGSSTVVNVGSAAHELGWVGHFEEQKEKHAGVKEGEKLGFMEGMKRYGASKLLCLMMGYAFQRQLFAAYPHNKVHILTLDPGSMNGGGRLLGDEHHWVFPILYAVLGTLGPVLRLVKKDAINPPAVPAKAIADIFGNDKYRDQIWKNGLFFVLDDEKKSSALSLDTRKQDEVWKNVSSDLSLEEGLSGLDL